MDNRPIRERLLEHGIRLQSYAIGQHYTTCPNCSQHRKKKSDPCLSVKLDDNGGAVWKCNHCGDFTGNIAGTGYRGEAPPRKAWRKPLPPKPAGEKAMEALYGWFGRRGISREAVDFFGVHPARHWIPAKRAEAACIAFPYRSGGELLNVKYRTPDKEFAQEKDARKTLFNIDGLADNDTAVWVEGECDVLACFDAGFQNAVTIPDGSPKQPVDPDDERHLRRFIPLEEHADILDGIRHHVIATDNDGPGRNLADYLVRRLGPERCFQVRFPDGCKDPNDVLREHGAATLRDCLDHVGGSRCSPWPMKGLAQVEMGAIDKALDLSRRRVYHCGIPDFDEHYRFTRGTVTIWTGIPGDGKSEFIDQCMIGLSQKYDWRWAVCSPESIMEDQIANLAAKFMRRPVTWQGHIPDKPSMADDADAKRQAEEYLRDHFLFIHQDDVDAELTSDFIFERARYAVLRYRISGLVIDPFNEVEDKDMGSMGIDQYVRRFLTRCRKFARRHDISVHIVAHPKSLATPAQAKGREQNAESKPVVGMYDIAGGAQWYNKADMGVTVYVPPGGKQRDHESFGKVEIHVKKVKRKWMGRVGKVDLRYHDATGTYTSEKADAAAVRSGGMGF